MTNHSYVALALVLGGIVCILASIAGVMYLYHEHAAQLTNRDDSLPAFAVFAMVPGVAGFVVGGVLVAIGIIRDIKDKSP